MSTTVLGLSADHTPSTLFWSTHTDVARHLPRPLAASPDLDPAFVFDFEAYDDLGDGQRWSTWLSVEPLCRGPEPRPDWVVTSQAAVDTDLGILKTGKEADAFLLERAVPAARHPTSGSASPWSWSPSATAAPSTAPSTGPRPTPRAAA